MEDEDKGPVPLCSRRLSFIRSTVGFEFSLKHWLLASVLAFTDIEIRVRKIPSGQKIPEVHNAGLTIDQRRLFRPIP